MVAIAEKIRTRRSRFEFVFDRPRVLGSAFLSPAILYVLLLVGVPFLLAVYYALSAYTIYNPSYHFVGLQNFFQVVQSDVFRRTLLNTFIFTIGSQALGLVLGKFGALLLLRPFPRAQDRAGADHSVLGGADRAYHSRVGVDVRLALQLINWTLIALGLMTRANAPNWLGEPGLAMLCVIIVNVWRFFPFAIVIFLAGITAVPQDVLDAATVDGAGFWRRYVRFFVKEPEVWGREPQVAAHAEP